MLRSALAFLAAMALFVVLILHAPARASTVSSGGMSSGTVSQQDGPAPQPPDYRTIAVLGDLQGFTREAPGGRMQDLTDAVTYLIDNKVALGLDAVIGVGDFADKGTPLPTGRGGTQNTNLECDGVGPYPSDATCGVNDGTDELTCEAVANCFWFSPGPNDCLSCQWVLDADAEWDAYDAEIARLTAAEIVVLMAPGNHDNKGEFAATPAEPDGWEQRYGLTYWQNLETTSSTWPVTADLLANLEDATAGRSYAWQIDLQHATPRTILVVSVPYQAGVGLPATQEQWAIDRMADYPTLPALLIQHHLGEVRTSIINQSETVAPNLFAAVGGHIGWPSGGNRKTISQNGTGPERVLEVETDYTNETEVPSGSGQRDTNNLLQTDYITFIRFWDSPEEIETDDWSTAGDAFINDTAGLGAESQVARQSFSITPPPVDTGLWDLSPYQTEITSYLGTHTWPALPVTTIGPVTAATCAELANLADDGATHIQVTAALTGCGSITLASDTFVEFMSASAGTTGASWSFPNANTRARVKGGTHSFGGSFSVNGNDLTIDDGSWTTTGGGTLFLMGSGSDPERIAFVGLTTSAGTYCGIVTPFDRFAINDLSIVGTECTCSNSQDEACWRVQGGNRTLVAASWANNLFNSKQMVRFYGENHDSLVIDNIVATKHTSGAAFWAVGDNDVQIGNLDNIGFIRNRIFNGASGGGYFDFFNQQNNGGFTCTNIDVVDNDKISSTAAAFNALYSGCTGSNTGNEAIDLDLAPYGGNEPTCTVDYGRDPLCCGAGNAGCEGGGGGQLTRFFVGASGEYQGAMTASETVYNVPFGKINTGWDDEESISGNNGGLQPNDRHAIGLVGSPGQLQNLQLTNGFQGLGAGQDVTETIRLCTGGDVQHPGACWGDSGLAVTLTGGGSGLSPLAAGPVAMSVGEVLNRQASWGTPPDNGPSDSVNNYVEYQSSDGTFFTNFTSTRTSGGNTYGPVTSGSTLLWRPTAADVRLPLPGSFNLVGLHCTRDLDWGSTAAKDMAVCLGDGVAASGECNSLGAVQMRCPFSAGAASCTTTTCEDGTSGCAYTRGDLLFASKLPDSFDGAHKISCSAQWEPVTPGQWFDGVCLESVSGTRYEGIMTGYQPVTICDSGNELACRTNLPNGATLLAVEGFMEGTPGGTYSAVLRDEGVNALACDFVSAPTCSGDGPHTFDAGDDVSLLIQDGGGASGQAFCMSHLWDSL